jgi:hypothetical protein
MANEKVIKFHREGLVPTQCSPVQLDGLVACKTCPHRDARGDEACMSPEIRKSGMNAAGIKVPLKERSTPKKAPRENVISK